VIAQTGAITFRNTTINTSACAAAPVEESEEEESEEAVAGLPDSGGAPIPEDMALPWSLVAVAGVSAFVLAAGVLAFRRRSNLKK
jgi:hypothetical protein